jgi:hypothetical protein
MYGVQQSACKTLKSPIFQLYIYIYKKVLNSKHLYKLNIIIKHKQIITNYDVVNCPINQL